MFRPQYDKIDAKVWCFSKESRSACFPVYQHFRKKKRAPGEIWGRSPPPGGLGGLPPLGSFWPLAFLTLFTSFENFKFFLRRARCSVWSLPLRGLFGPLTLFTLFTSFENFKFFLRRARCSAWSLPLRGLFGPLTLFTLFTHIKFLILSFDALRPRGAPTFCSCRK